MDIDDLRRLCLAFPGATEQMQWGDHLLFKVRGKMFAIASLEPSEVWLSLKTSAESFPELTERPGIIPAPYLARAKWIALESPTTVASPELATLLRTSYELVVMKLPKRDRDNLEDERSSGKTGKIGKRVIAAARKPKRKKRRS
jgi:predicted DNA-binding protein (MmcQ/YjbR family)